MIATFYSFKGGVGRSMALANVAEILAERGYRVMVCDWDLEAPGLERYLFETPEEVAAVRSSPGIIDLITEYKATLARPSSRAEGAETREDIPEGFTTVGGILLRKPSSHAVPVPPLSRLSGGSIHFLTVGKRGGEWTDRYNQAVRDADWTDFYTNWAGGSYFEFFRKDLQAVADVVLVDSRTGLTELGGVCTHHLADMVFLCSAANEQNIEGTLWMAQVLTKRELKPLRDGRELCVVPVPARIEVSEHESTPFRHRFAEQFWRFNQLWLDAVPEWKNDALLRDARNLIWASQIPYVPVYAFRESLIARTPVEKRHPELYQAYAVLAEIIVRWGIKRGGLTQLKQDVSGTVRELVVTPTTRSALPKGEFILVASDPDRPLAAQLGSTLRECGLAIWTEDRAQSSDPAATRVQNAINESAGYIVVLPSQPQGAWLEAELNVALRAQALKPGYRVLLIRTKAMASESTIVSAAVVDLLKRLQIVELPALTGVDNALRIIGELAPAQALVPETSPGPLVERLKTLTEHESRFFFGRDEEIRDVLARVETTLKNRSSALVLAGELGAGKTALVRAGLLPIFRRGLVGLSRKPWRVALATMKGDNPQRQIFTAVSEAFDLPVTGTEDWVKLTEAIARSSDPFLLVIDNAHEIFFGTAPDAAVAGPFLRKLGELRSVATTGFFVIYILPINTLEEWQRNSDLTEKLLTPERELLPKSAEFKLGPLSPNAIQTFLEASARLLGVTIQPGLIELILEDMMRVKPSPRIVGTVLQRLWERRNSSGQLTHQTYRAFGGVEGVVLEDAEHALRKLAPPLIDPARELVTALIDVRTQTRLRLSRPELLALATDQHLAGKALASLTEKNVITVCDDRELTLASDGLVKTEIVQSWLAKTLSTRLLRDELEHAARRWEESDRIGDYLPSGKALSSFETVDRPSSLATEFLRKAALAQADGVTELRRARRLKTGLAVATGISAIILAVAFQSDRSKRQILARELKLTNQLAVAEARLEATNIWAGEQIETWQNKYEELNRQTGTTNQSLARLQHDFNRLQRDLANATDENNRLKSTLTNAETRFRERDSLAVIHLIERDAEFLRKPFEDRGFKVERNGTDGESKITYIDPADQGWAQALAPFFKELGLQGNLKIERGGKSRPGQIDVWLSPKDVDGIRQRLYTR